MRVNSKYKFTLHMFFLFFLAVGIGELFFRSRGYSYNPTEQTGYDAFKNQYSKIKEYVDVYGTPDCIFIGNSLMQTGIDPEIFQNNFYKNGGPLLNCYNFGMDASSISSTAAIAFLLIDMYAPSYVIWTV